MQFVRPLLAASILSLVVTAGGCSNHNSSDYRPYTPPVETAADDQSGAPPAADASEPSPLTDNAVPVEPPATPDTTDAADLTAASPTADVDASSTADETADPVIVTTATIGGETPTAITADSNAGDDATATSDDTPGAVLIAAVGATNAPPAEPRETKLLIPEKSFRKEGDSLRVSYDDIDLLKVLNMEPVTVDAPQQFPEWLKGLDGQRICIRGYMRPGELSEYLPFFVLARDTQACCFGPNTKPYDIIPVIMRDGVTTDYIHLRPFDLVGVFHINVEMDLDDPHKVEFLYFIDDAVLISK